MRGPPQPTQGFKVKYTVNNVWTRRGYCYNDAMQRKPAIVQSKLPLRAL